MLAGQTATFSVTATGTAPLSYQWRKDGADIGDATASTYKIPGTIPSDSGAKFSVVVTQVINSATSADAILTVTVSEVFAEVDRPVLDYNTPVISFWSNPGTLKKRITHLENIPC